MKTGEIGVYSLNHLFDLPYRLRKSIPVRVVWEEEMGGYAAYDDMFGCMGVGDNMNMSLRHLAEVIAENYEDLEQNAERLFPNLREKLEQMRKVLVMHQSRDPWPGYRNGRRITK